MKILYALLRKELLLELRQKHALAGVGLYVLATVYVCFLSFEKIESTKVFSALLWVTGLFTAFNAMQKTFSSEVSGTQLYLYSLVPPRMLILSKALYNAAQVAVLNIFSLLFFILFFGTEPLSQTDILQFILGLALGSTGLGIALTFVSALAYRSGGGGLVSILGFPVVIPLLITMVKFTGIAMEGGSLTANGFNLLVLIVLNILSLILALILFPYMWRE